MINILLHLLSSEGRKMDKLTKIEATKLEEGDIIYLEDQTIHLLECWKTGSDWWKGVINGPKDLLAGRDCHEAELAIEEINGKEILKKSYTSINPISGLSHFHTDKYEIIKIQKAGCKKRADSFQKYHAWLDILHGKEEMTFREAAALLKPIEEDQLCLKTAVDHSTVNNAVRLAALMCLSGLSLTEKQFALFRDHAYIH